MRETILPSGAKLKITLAPFKDARSLYQAILDEVKVLKIDGAMEVDYNLFKDLMCTCLASKKVEACVWDCMKRATINDLKITEDTFEPEEARGDYLSVCIEIAKENVMPFMKSLYAEFSPILGKIKKSPA